jgi:hypothetical protein
MRDSGRRRYPSLFGAQSICLLTEIVTNARRIQKDYRRFIHWSAASIIGGFVDKRIPNARVRKEAIGKMRLIDCYNAAECHQNSFTVEFLKIQLFEKCSTTST